MLDSLRYPCRRLLNFKILFSSETWVNEKTYNPTTRLVRMRRIPGDRKLRQPRRVREAETARRRAGPRFRPAGRGVYLFDARADPLERRLLPRFGRQGPFLF